MDTATKEVLSTNEPAENLRVKPQTLRAWRLNGGGPEYSRLGSSNRSHVRYRLNEINKWLDDHSAHHTAEEDLIN